MCPDLIEYGSVCISQEKWRQTYLHDVTSDSDVKPNDPDGLRVLEKIWLKYGAEYKSQLQENR